MSGTAAALRADVTRWIWRQRAALCKLAQPQRDQITRRTRRPLIHAVTGTVDRVVIVYGRPTAGGRPRNQTRLE